MSKRFDLVAEVASYFQIWQDLEEKGMADALDSAECRRVFKEWVMANFPCASDFISVRVNFTPRRREKD